MYYLSFLIRVTQVQKQTHGHAPLIVPPGNDGWYFIERNIPIKFEYMKKTKTDHLFCIYYSNSLADWR